MSTTAPPTYKTYRGRKLEDLIPQIRAELGPDAIILREREGLMGGVSGFFAQRCVEVDVQAAPRANAKPAPRVDVFDEPPVSFASELAEASDLDEDPAPAEDTMPAAGVPLTEVHPRKRPARRSRRARRAAPEPVEEAVPAPSVVMEPQFEPLAVDLEPLPEEPDPELIAAEVELTFEPDSDEVEDIDDAEDGADIGDPEDRADIGDPEDRADIDDPEDAADIEDSAEARTDDATAIAEDLLDSGLSEAWSQQLIAAAAAHRLPFAAYGGLRDAVRTTLAASMPAPHPLPPGGAAIAIVGAGGSGKTRCAALLACSYSRASSLSVSVVALGGEERGRHVKDVLGPAKIPVTAAIGGAAAQTVAAARDGGMVIVDTGAATPADPLAVSALADELGRLDLDAVYVAVPATLSQRAARKLLEAFRPLRATGIVVTHLDEADDQLGIVAELACGTGLPVTFIQDGVDLSLVNPSILATRLLR